MSSWPTKTIGQLIEEGAILVHKDGNHGANYPRVSEFVDDGLPFLTAKSISDWKLDIEGASRLSEAKAATFKFGFIQPDDVLLSHNATVGRVALVPEFEGKAVIGTSLTHFRLNKKILNPRYLAVCFMERDFQNQLSFGMTQTTRNQVPITAQRHLPVTVPPIELQNEIADRAFSLLDKIELNRRMNETLEEMARALFRDWFVDFGPTRRQMAGATDACAIMGHAFPAGDMPEKVGPGFSSGISTTKPLTAETLAPLFPAKLGNDGLPEGWDLATVGALSEKVTKGTTPRKADLSNATSNEAVPFYRVVNLSKGGQLLQNSVQQVPLDVHLGALKRSVLQADDILYSIAGTIGRVCKIEQRDVPANLNQALAIVRPDKSKTTPNFLLLGLRSRSFQDELHSNVVQAVQANLSLGMISNAPMLSLPTHELQQIMEPIDLLLANADANEQENQTLAEMRDLLLPKLMSGEIRLKDAEAAL